MTETPSCCRVAAVKRAFYCGSKGINTINSTADVDNNENLCSSGTAVSVLPKRASGPKASRRPERQKRQKCRKPKNRHINKSHRQTKKGKKRVELVGLLPLIDCPSDTGGESPTLTAPSLHICTRKSNMEHIMLEARWTRPHLIGFYSPRLAATSLASAQMRSNKHMMLTARWKQPIPSARTHQGSTKLSHGAFSHPSPRPCCGSCCWSPSRPIPPGPSPSSS